MANPTPLYRVKFNGSFLPGYLQEESHPVNKRNTTTDLLNRNGGISGVHGARPREVSLSMRVLTRLDSATGVGHLNDCQDQYAEALAICDRATTAQQLFVGDQTKYLNAIFTGASTTLTAGENRRLTYSLKFTADPYFLDVTPVTGSITGNGTLNLTMPDTRETYPVFSVPSGVTGFTASSGGKTVTFLRGTYPGTITIDCSNFHVTNSNGDASGTMKTMNFGIKHTTGAGTFAIVTTGYAGSGTIGVSVTPRYELNI